MSQEEVIEQPTPRTFTEEDIQRARQQEKDKLYAQINKLSSFEDQYNSLQGEVESLRKDREAREAEEAKRRKQEEANAKKEAEERLTVQQLLEKREAEWKAEREADRAAWQTQLETINNEREQEKVLLEKEREFAALQSYIQQRVAEERENIAPELIDLVNGRNKEEVDNSIATLKAKSDAIVNSITETRRNAAAAQPGVSTAGYATTGPMNMEPGTKQYSVEELKNLDVTSPEYAAIRKSLKIGSGSGYGQGLFG